MSLRDKILIYENDAVVPYNESLRNFQGVKSTLIACGVNVKEETLQEKCARVYGLYQGAELEVVVDNYLPRRLDSTASVIPDDKTHISIVWQFERELGKEEREGRFWPLLGIYREVERVLGGK